MPWPRRVPPLLAALALLTATVAHAATVTVRPGDTLFRIATRAGTTVQNLKRLNGLRGDTIRAGQDLRVSGAPTPRATPAQFAIITVRRGDTLGVLATRARTTVAALKAANGLRSDTIRVGQVLRLPGATVRAAPRPTTVTRVIYSFVTVTPGQDLTFLARTYRTSAAHLRNINHLRGNSTYAGQRVLVPKRVPVAIPPRPVRAPITLARGVSLGVPVRIVRVDLRHPDVRVTPIAPPSGFGTGLRVGDLARTTAASAIINGSYFHPRTYAPAGDLVLGGRLLAWGRVPYALAITPDNRATIRAKSATWRGFESVVASGPRILVGGRVQRTFSPIFRDQALYRRAARSAVGVRGNRDLIFLNTSAALTVTETAKIMQRLGATDALLLDGGSSAGLAWNGHALKDSARRVAYGIAMYANYTGKRYAR
ncbi:LysM peptidoglycan-binding domain-containing protein [Deinococcus maricopensis]|uniref:Peptidoglycan-binding lysin domain protein n=1 Tax=Deinococcus maricopensis (strain DSM 21211 / LMG 22137 / NRRL B-23946 / LB-34) TaxID=709986 RepID=E8U842_DEIML|nr:LysM peptidoglycan-binding domain-containing protein [Deinococcus maricopensis]ADV67231.1 Peptidoglycan-binding lysin domain protein [Deinococcus maricopensis DSM 21211]